MSVSRYLTAQKVSLLVLVKLYCDAVLPSSATIPVLSFILSQNVPRPSSFARGRNSRQDHDASFSIDAFEEVLQGHASNMPGRTLLDIFLKQMWEVNSFHALHELFESSGHLLARGPGDPDRIEPEYQDQVLLAQASPLGLFVRRMQVEFHRLPFDDAMRVWSSFIVYRAPTAQWNKRIAGLAGTSGIDRNAAELGIGPGDKLFDLAYGDLADEVVSSDALSVEDFSRLLEFQCDKLQSLGCRVSDEMRVKLRSMFGPSGVALRQTHLVEFFDAWKAGEYTSAFDRLHQYFDYAVQTQQRTHYQYALLHMAVLQAEFSCFSEAVAAINEAITTARENQDMHCLNFSLSWLNHMSKAYPKQLKASGYMGTLGSERDGLTYLKARAKESEMYPLLSSTLLNEASLFLGTGDSVVRAFEYMYQASHLNIREHINNHGSHALLQSTIYARLGVTHLSHMHCDLLLDCYQDGCPFDDVMRAISRRAFTAMNYGRFDDALNHMDTIDPSFHRTLKFHRFIFLGTGLIKFKRAIRRTDWDACESFIPLLQPDTSTDPELAYVLAEAQIDYLISRGYYDQAFAMIEDTVTSLREEGADIIMRVNMLIAKATLFAKVGSPQRGFSIALRAANVAFKARLMPALWKAVGLLCNVLNSIGEYQAAMRLLHAVIPQSLENSDSMLIGTLYSNIADSYMGLAGLDDPSSANGSRSYAANISRADLYLDRARDYFKKVEDIEYECEQLMKKAFIAKLRGDEKVADEWAHNHNRVWEE
ncbi:hypothetical protein BU24DRAFT_362512, partial [Aaosphaeria arxii CBS 175.79]